MVIGGDRANANFTDGDGADSIKLAGTFISSTVYGAGGNDSLSWSGNAGSGNVISLGAGEDVFTGKAGTILDNSTLGAGAGNDAIYFEKSGAIQGTRINLGKGNDTIFANGMDVLSGFNYSGSTIYGGAGADYFLKDASASQNVSTTVVAEFLYEANTESVLSAYDTIGVDFGDSGDFAIRYAPGGLTRLPLPAATQPVPTVW